MGGVSSAEMARKDIDTVEVTKCISYRIGEWLPSDQAVLQKWLQKQIEVDGATSSLEAGPNDDEPDVGYTLHPVVQRFKKTIETNAVLSPDVFRNPKEVQTNPNSPVPGQKLSSHALIDQSYFNKSSRV